MTEKVIDGAQLIFIAEEAEAIGDFNSVRIWLDGKEILYPKDLKMVFYIEDGYDDLKKEIETHLLRMFGLIGIDKPTSFEGLVEYIEKDVRDCTDADSWTTEDVNIAFRRFLEDEGVAKDD